MSTPDQTEAIFKAKFQAEQQAIDRLAKIDRKRLGPGSANNIDHLKEIDTRGLDRALGRRRSEDSKEQIRELVREFILYGAKAVLLTGAQRGGDFLNNQLRGQWAERVALSMKVDGLHLVPFGPSGAAMASPVGRSEASGVKGGATHALLCQHHSPVGRSPASGIR